MASGLSLEMVLCRNAGLRALAEPGIAVTFGRARARESSVSTAVLSPIARFTVRGGTAFHAGESYKALAWQCRAILVALANEPSTRAKVIAALEQIEAQGGGVR